MRILIIVESGIGNICLISPLIKSLYQVYNKPEITLLSSPYRKEGKILEGWFYLKNCIYTARDLKHEDFDQIFVSPMYGNVFNYFLINIPKNKLIPINCGNTINWHKEHEVEVNMRIARKLGYIGITPSTEVNTKKPKKFIKLSKKIKIGFHTGCLNHKNYSKKLWINRKWDELAKRLEKELNAQIIWFGSKEQPYKEKIWDKDYAGKTGINLVGKYEDIRETAYMINKCDLFISLDSGLAHVANALFVPTIALFGPTLPTKNRPYNQPSVVINSGVCRPCYFTTRYHSCKDNICMKEIKIDEIIEQSKKLLEKKTLKVFLIACKQLGNTLARTLKRMKNVDFFFYYDYSKERHDFSQTANEYDIVLVLKGIGVNLDYLKRVTARKVLWFNDNVCRYRNEFEQMRPLFDNIFTTNKDKEPNTECIPFGIDTQFYDMKLNRDIDVSFVGYINNEDRRRWLKEIKELFPIKTFQDIQYPEYTNILNRSKITINKHYNKCGANMRFFEAMACKSLMITDKVKGIPKDMKEGKHYITYKDVPDLIQKIRFYIQNSKERERITDNAYELVNKKHKYSDRLKEMFRKLHLK